MKNDCGWWPIPSYIRDMTGFPIYDHDLGLLTWGFTITMPQNNIGKTKKIYVTFRPINNPLLTITLSIIGLVSLAGCHCHFVFHKGMVEKFLQLRVYLAQLSGLTNLPPQGWLLFPLHSNLP